MKNTIADLISTAVKTLQDAGELPAELSPTIHVEHTKDKSHGDFACNIALMLAKPAKQNPRKLAELIVAHLPESDKVEKVDIAGPGFINFFQSAANLWSMLDEMLTRGKDYGRCTLGQGKKVLVEFVSANPTGPLHVGHGRGASFGSAVSNLLAAVGYDVSREYYVNDAGRQMDILATSVWLRYLEHHGATLTFPRNGYKGDYVKIIAANLASAHEAAFVQPIDSVMSDLPQDETEDGQGDKEAYIDALIARAKSLLGAEHYDTVHAFGLDDILQGIKDDLAEYRVVMDNWFSEKSLVSSGAIAHALEVLDKAGHTYEKEGAIWFRATAFGDDKDRVLVRDNGQTTYFASDVAYHLNKFERGFEWIVDVLGSDHHGYVPRVKAAISAMGKSPEQFTAMLVQFATLYRGSERLPMSTRSGEFVTLKDLYDEVGIDAARFFYVMRKNEQHMDFDLELAKKQSNDNPVYYIQYAHARVCSVLRQAEDKGMAFDQALGQRHLSLLTSSHESTLLTKLNQYSDRLRAAGNNAEPHMIAHYLLELATDFHSYYNAEAFLVEDEALRNARLLLISATRQILANGLELLAVSAPSEM